MNELAEKISTKVEKLEGVKTKKTAKKISYSHNLPFAAINIKKDTIELEFITPSQINHAKLKKIKKIKADKFKHFITIKTEADIDPQVSGWLIIAHATN